MFQKECEVIEEVTEKNFNEVLPLIMEYQEFYGVESIDNEKNRLFFSQFANNHENGILHIYRSDGKAIGFTTIYKGFSSTRAEIVGVLNDLYVQPSCRGKGYGKELISHAFKVAKSMGFARLQWLTSQDNIEAQKLYNNSGANRSSWFFYAKET